MMEKILLVYHLWHVKINKTKKENKNSQGYCKNSNKHHRGKKTKQTTHNNKAEHVPWMKNIFI